MSFAKNILSNAIGARAQARGVDPATIQQLSNIAMSLDKLVSRTGKPMVLIQSNKDGLSSNVADGVLIIQSPVMGYKEYFVVEDLNVNFTTALGTVRIVKVRGYNGLIIEDVVRDLAASNSGIGSPVLQEGEALAVVGQVAGAGVFGVFCSGKKYRLE